MKRICFNGKFLSAHPTGVHRVAAELISGVDQILRDREDLASTYQWELLCPKNATHSLDLQIIEPRTVGVSTWQIWEQFELPFYVRDAFLVNLCNLAPLASRDAMTMIHDAQTFISPESYSWAFRTWYQFALPMIGKQNKRVLTVSDFSRQQLDEFGIAPKDKISVLHNGVDHVDRTAPDEGILARLNLDSGGFALGLANTQVHKNVRILMEAFSDPQLSSRSLVLFGGANQKDFEVLGVQVPPNVIFAGYVSEAELKALMVNARVLVFPSTTEGFGLPPLEAMHLGTPAVCAPCGALPEVCGEAAYYASPEDACQWVDAISQYFGADVEHMREISCVSRTQAAKFSWSNASSLLLQYILDDTSDDNSA